VISHYLDVKIMTQFRFLKAKRNKGKNTI